MRDSGSILSHVYGIAGLVPGLVSIVYLVRTDATWREYALVASGWVAALLYGLMLYKCFRQAREDGLQLGKYAEQIEGLKAELSRRSSTADYLAALLMGRHATPRVASPPPPTQD